MKNVLRALQYFRGDAGKILLAAALLLLGTGASLLKPWPLAWMVDSVLGAKPLPESLAALRSWEKPAQLAAGGLLILLLHGLQAGLSALQNDLSIRAGLRGLARLRKEFFHRMQRLSLRFHQGSQQGDLIYRASWDTHAIQTLLQQGAFTFLGALISLTLMVAVMWSLNPRLTLVSLGTLPPLLLAMQFFGRVMRDKSRAAHQSDSLVTSFLQQTIVSLPLIQSYTREAHEEGRFAGRVEDAYRRRRSQHGWELLYWLVIGVIYGAGVAAITWLGAREVLAGRVTVGELLIFLAYLSQWYEPLNQLSRVGSTVADAGVGIQRVFEILDTPVEVAEPAQPKTPASAPGAARGAVEFRHVSFAYVPGQPVLRNVSFAVKPGETVALIGPSGAGKTTLLQLLPRFYDPAEGAVLLDGTDLRDLALRDLRSQVSLVLQEPLLLPATVAENIACGKPDASAAEIESAARAARAHEFIERLPEGYATLIGEGGARLSVGEKQRLNLARAFLKDAPILLLDEPTSALDAENEVLIIESLERLMAHRTTLVVAHRLATVRRVDKVVVLDGGAVQEMGPPEELMAAQGYFARAMSVYSPKIS